MATPNRAAIIKKMLRVLRKHYQPYTPPKDRTLLDHLLFACLLENSTHEAAERAFVTLDKDFYDLNEVRVSTVKELSEGFKGLNDPEEAADRLKRTLHSVFESFYAFDAESLKKQNLGQAVKTLSKLNGTTPFVVAYATQNGLGGHSIPVNQGLFLALEVVGVITEQEAKKGIVPGIERAVPKSKGVEVGSLMHQLGVEVGRNPYGPSTKKLLLEIDSGCKDRLPKRPPKEEPAPPEPPAEPKKKGKKGKAAESEDGKPTKEPKPAKPVAKEKKPVKKKTAAKKKTASKAKAGKKKTAKKTTGKKNTGKKKPKKKTTSRRLSKKKPR